MIPDKFKGTWTLFWDMHSGGGLKEPPYSKIYIQAPEKEAMSIFYSKFDHNPERVSCTCCGDDYSIQDGNITDVSGYHRNLPALRVPRKNGRYQPLPDGCPNYHEPGTEIPKGVVVESDYRTQHGPTSLEDYAAQEDVLFLFEADIEEYDRNTDIPESGYVWVE